MKQFLPSALLALLLCFCGQSNAASKTTTAAAVRHVVDTAQSPNEEPKSVQQLFDNLRAKWPKNRTINVVFHGHSVPSGYHKTPQVKPFDSYPSWFIRA